MDAQAIDLTKDRYDNLGHSYQGLGTLILELGQLSSTNGLNNPQKF